MNSSTVVSATVLLLVAALSPGATANAGTNYYVDKDSIGGPCSDDAPGTSSSAPWCTIARANRSLRAGDGVYIRTGAYAESIAPEHDGAEGLPIRYRIDDSLDHDDSVMLTGVGTAINMVGRSYILVDGIGAEHVDRFITLDNSHHISIYNGWFGNHNNQGGWPTGILFKNNAHHNVLGGCTVGGVGYSTADDDIGCVMNLGVWENPDDNSDHNLLEGNTFYSGGHHVLAISSSYNVVLSNTFQNENWMDCARAETGGRCGNRNIIFEYDASNVAWNVVEHNWFKASGVPPDDNTSAGMSVRTPHNIVRRNLFENSDGPGLDVSVLTGLWDASDNHIYHNVMVHNGYTALPDVEHWKQAGLLVAHHGEGVPIVDLAIKNNILFDNKAHGMMFYYTDRAAQVVEGNWDEAGDPGFDDPDHPVRPDDPPMGRFGLRPDSPCIDGGVFLTATTAGGSGVEIPVVDAGYFSDGREVVDGDLIELERATVPEGTTVVARVVAIDYARNVLTVDRPLVWTAGQGVSQPYDGASPDIGRAERWAPPPTPVATPTAVRRPIHLPITMAPGDT
jgi:hypothetical protein